VEITLIKEHEIEKSHEESLAISAPDAFIKSNPATYPKTRYPTARGYLF
jgi:hypothetical protein